MSLFSTHQILYAPDDGGAAGGIPPSGAPGASAPKGVSPAVKSLEKHIQELSDTNKRIFKLLSKSLGVGAAEDDTDNQTETLAKSFGDIFQESVTDPLKDIFNFDDLFGGLFGGGDEDSLLGGMFGKSKERPKERPRLSDMMKMPAEHSLGYTLLYWKLDEIAGLLDPNSKSKKEEKGKGLGGFFQGLLKGAAGLALLAGSMMLFAGALLLFTKLEGSDWAKALAGIGMFALFVVGAVVVAKAVAKEEQTFFDFAKGVLALTASMILFGAAVFVMAWILPYVIEAIPGIALFGAFVAGAVFLANRVNQNTGNFVQFGLGVMVLTVGLALFAGAIFVTNWAGQYLVGAIPTLIAFAVFTLAMVGIASILGANLGQFALFAVGAVLLSVGLVAFGYALKITSDMGQYIEGALPVLVTMGLVMGAVALLGLAAGNMIAGAIGILAGSVALLLGLMAFRATLEIANSIELDNMNHMWSVIGTLGAISAAVGAMGLVLLLALPGIALFGTAGAALALGMLGFRDAIVAVAEIGGISDAGLTGLSKIQRFLSNPDALDDDGNFRPGVTPGVIEIMRNVNGPTLLKLRLFGSSLEVFSSGMIAFARVIERVAEVSDKVDPALIGLERMMTFLSNPDGAMDEDGRLNGGRPGVLQLLDGVNRRLVRRFRQFGRAMDPFFNSMLTFAQVIDTVSKVGDEATISLAIDSVGRMMGLLVGGPGIPEGSDLVSIFEGMSYHVAPLLEAFGSALGPLMNALLSFAEVIDRVKSLTAEEIQDAGNNLGAMYLFLNGNENSVVALLGGISSGDSRRIGRFGASLSPLSEGLSIFVGVINQVRDITATQVNDAIVNLDSMMAFLQRASTMAADVGGGKFLGLGSSNMEKFEEAITPFGSGVRSFISIARSIGSASESIQTSDVMLTTMVRMLTAAGAVVDRGGSPQQVGQFKTSLDLLGDGINRFTGQVEGTAPFVLDRIADALERIAEIQFGQMFVPFIQFMEHNEKLTETATQLERINEAITPRQPNTLDRISGAIGSIFNRGGERANLNDTETAEYVASPGVDGSMEGYVAGMYEILSRWDMSPIQLPTGEAGTNMMVLQSGAGAAQEPAFGGNF